MAASIGLTGLTQVCTAKRILQQNSLAQHWARDWRALALTQVHHGSRLSDSCEGGEALSSVHPPTPATGKLIHNLLCDCRVLGTGLARTGSKEFSFALRTLALTLCGVWWRRAVLPSLPWVVFFLSFY